MKRVMIVCSAIVLATLLNGCTGVTSARTNAAAVNTTSTSTNPGSPATAPVPGTTWYVRSDGGTRYSANNKTGQCSGRADAAYSGSGTNQPCAFNDFRYLYSDGTYNNKAWVISGGDTVIVRNGPWRIGQKGPNSRDFFGNDPGDPYGASNPTIPPGTSAQHTRILGENYANCTTKTQLHGGYAVYEVLNLAGAQYVDVQCLEITDYAQCSRVGTPAYPSSCNSSFPLDDYATGGIATDVNTHDVLLQDLDIHGLTHYGLFGPIGGLITMTRVRVAFNGFAGWMFDDGHSTPDALGSNIVASYVTMEWNGCNEEYPIVDTYPAISCYDDQSGGFGDAWSAQGTGSGGQLSQLAMTCDHCIMRYNTKDGFGMNHIVFTSLSITNSLAYANMGQQIKWSANQSSTEKFVNNEVIGNCRRMHDSITGAPSTFNTYLSHFCRAFDTMDINFPIGGTLQFDHNTIVGASVNTLASISCGVGGTTCSGSTNILRNNVFLGFTDTQNPGWNSSPIALFCYSACNGSSTPTDDSMWTTRSNNLFYGFKAGTFACSYVTEVCSDPQLVNEPSQTWTAESQLDNFNFSLTSGSPARYAGIAIGGLTADFAGNTWSNPPSIGAIQYH
jgi:hypothetical protein